MEKNHESPVCNCAAAFTAGQSSPHPVGYLEPLTSEAGWDITLSGLSGSVESRCSIHESYCAQVRRNFCVIVQGAKR